MQAYGKAFAKVYNQRWGAFAAKVSEGIIAFYESRAIAKSKRTILDLCCGTGVLLGHFLGRGYRGVGLDLSPHMIEWARANNRQYVERGSLRLVVADAAAFTLEETFGLVTCTFDALNHLPDEAAVLGCFRSVARVLGPDGYFIFDVNTRQGLGRWKGVQVENAPDLLIVNHGIYELGMPRALTQISGFSRVEGSDLYERFEETVYNTVFDVERLTRMLAELGWRKCHHALIEDLGREVPDPEAHGRIFFVARR